jgi:hypothetical protein
MNDARIKIMISIAGIAIMFLLVTRCSNSDPSQDSQTTDNPSGSATPENLRILFRWPGDDFATRQQLETRDKIVRLIEERQIGFFIQSGTGMGWMDIVVAVDDKSSARNKIEKIINEISPQANFSLL